MIQRLNDGFVHEQPLNSLNPVICSNNTNVICLLHTRDEEILDMHVMRRLLLSEASLGFPLQPTSRW